ncbi:MlaA family lipoprotein [Sphingomonas sp. 1P06PA]|uniref:MlaA family lipoprotein n=1 Tax=Sphingomonas sp. 1P06PA TaxID=554121 RepID=UPI0039A4F544
MHLLVGAAALAFVAGPAIAQPSAAPAPTEAPVDATTEADADAPLPPAGPTEGDPYESLNRGIWGFNQGVDKVLLKPASSVYRFVTPRPARRGIHAIFANLSEPWSFINNLLQGKPGPAFNNLGRFLINTTLGVGGLADHATDLGLKPKPEDFGQTLARWGVKSSAYVVLPVLGPSTVRDGVGTGVAFFADPYRICLNQCVNLDFAEQAGITALSVLDTRATLTESGADAFLESSLDPYASARSAYLQRREAEIADTERSEDVDPAPASVDPTTPEPAEPAPVADPSAPATTADPVPSAQTPDAPAEPDATTDQPKLSYLFNDLKG